MTTKVWCLYQLQWGDHISAPHCALLLSIPTIFIDWHRIVKMSGIPFNWYFINTHQTRLLFIDQVIHNHTTPPSGKCQKHPEGAGGGHAAHCSVISNQSHFHLPLNCDKPPEREEEEVLTPDLIFMEKSVLVVRYFLWTISVFTLHCYVHSLVQGEHRANHTNQAC